MDVKFKVLEVLGEDPTISYSAIAAQVGVTRERVRQIAQRNGYPPRTGVSKLKMCPICGNTFITKNLYCSSACRYKSKRIRVVVNCHQCGKPKERTPGNMRSKSGRYFCSRVCFGKWISENHLIKTKSRKPVVGNFKYEIGSREEFPSKGRAPSPEVMKIYNTMLNLEEN